MAIAQSPLGQGWEFPLGTTVQGNLGLSLAEQNIEDCIHVILRTRLGERVYRPDFGSRLSELVFAPLNSETLLRIQLYVEEALIQWEPRIVLEAVHTEPDSQGRGQVTITIQYRTNESPDSRNLVYPFYLVPPEESP